MTLGENGPCNEMLFFIIKSLKLTFSITSRQGKKKGTKVLIVLLTIKV